MKPIIVNLPTFTVGLLNDNADYCINVCFNFSNFEIIVFFVHRLQKNFIIIINFVNHLIYVKSMLNRLV